MKKKVQDVRSPQYEGLSFFRLSKYVNIFNIFPNFCALLFTFFMIILRITYYTLLLFYLYFLNLLYSHLYLNCNYGRIAMQIKS